MTGGAAEKPDTRLNSAGFFITGSIIEPPQSRMGNRPGAHRAWLKADPYIIAVKPRLTGAGQGGLNRQYLGMVDRAAVTNHTIFSQRDKLSVWRNDSGRDRHLTRRAGRSGRRQHLIHIS